MVLFRMWQLFQFHKVQLKEGFYFKFSLLFFYFNSIRYN